MQDYKDILKKLTRFQGSLDDIQEALDQLAPGGEEELVTLTREDIVSVLNRFLQSEITARDVGDWASVLESREDIELGSEHDDDGCVQESIFKLATPELEGSLTRQRAQALADVLGATSAPSAEDIRSAYK